MLNADVVIRGSQFWILLLKSNHFLPEKNDKLCPFKLISSSQIKFLREKQIIEIMNKDE